MKREIVKIQGVEYEVGEDIKPDIKITDLLPCPFCGIKATWSHKHYRGKNLQRSTFSGFFEHKPKTLWWIGCHNARCFQPKVMSHDRNEACEKWNTRTINPHKVY